MRRLLLLAFTWGCLTWARAAAPEPLAAALQRATDDEDRWAYTETTVVRAADGKVEQAETAVRFDPSKPFEEQYTPLRVDGRAPSEKDRAKYRRQGVERGRQLQREAEREKPEKSGPGGDPPGIDVDGAEAKVDLEHAKLVREDAASLTYEVPLRARSKAKLPVDQLRLLIRVSRERPRVENVTAQLLAPMRVKLVAKVSRGEFSLDFTEVDPRYPPVLASVRVDFAASVLFVVRKSGTLEERRTDYQRVKPYFERFNVKIGPLKALPL